jgi:UDP-glucose 4-epimerase
VERTATRSRIEHAAERSGDIRHSRASAARLREAGWIPAHGFVRGLEETMRFSEERKP